MRKLNYLELINFFLVFLLFNHHSYAQSNRITFNGFDGYIVMGYVDKGAFLNFTGPNANVNFGNSRLVVGMLPSLRYKQDEGETRNSSIFPNLGTGITYSYKLFAIQTAFYYSPKTSTENGRWHMGVGLGIYTPALNKTNKKRKTLPTEPEQK